MILRIPKCVKVYLPLEVIIPGKLVPKNYSITYLIPWNIFLRDGSSCVYSPCKCCSFNTRIDIDSETYVS